MSEKPIAQLIVRVSPITRQHLKIRAAMVGSSMQRIVECAILEHLERELTEPKTATAT
jgi:hypothetical protein